MENEVKEELWTSFNDLHNSFSKFFDLTIKGEDITKSQAAILMFIAKEENISILKLSSQLELNQGNTSSLCKKMEQMGYINRIRNKEDERVVNIVLSDEGTKLAQRIENRLKEMEKYLKTFDKEKLDSIYTRN